MDQTLRILHLEDDPDDATLIHRRLEAEGLSVAVRHVQDLDAFRSALARDEFDLVLSDFRLGSATGLDALEVRKQLRPDVPFIFVSGALGEERAVETLRNGATDYVLKDRQARLGQAVRRALREVTERRQRDRAEAERDRFYALSLDLFCTLDAEGRLLDYNPSWQRVLGWIPEELQARPLRERVHAEDLPAFETMLAQLAEGLPVTSVETRLQARNGDWKWLLWSAQPVPLQSITYAAARDISLRKGSAEALRRSEEQLRQAQKMEAIGQLAGGVAHDFNNLLTAILGYAELMTMRLKPGDPLLRDVAEIRKAAERASALTRQLLVFSRKQMLSPRVLDLNAVVKQTESLLHRLIGEDVRLVSHLAPGLHAVRVDPGQLEQVLLNLAVNARDAMPRGGLLTLETQNVDLHEPLVAGSEVLAPGRYVMLAVSDTGVGMDRKTRQRVFEPFFTTKEQGKGTGLGLSTVYGIVRQSGGHVWVYSEPGHGACFRIYLPQAEAAPSAAEPAAQGPAPAHAVRGTETVLVVEDEPAVRDLTRQVLRLQGYAILDAANGGEALAVAAAHDGPIHLLVTDVVMPGMSGPELAGKLQAARPEMKMLFLSGYTSHAVVGGGMLEEGRNFLQKPFTPIDLAGTVRAILDRRA
ncbi:MAG TPA: response regulator [Candidatus Polarisedimenticolaceae bacterium]|nr:response regulator [Candidatus Polarisedimenticolaceae bacterium]